MSPIYLLTILVGAFVAILTIDHGYRRRRASLIAGIGAEFKMNYSPLDRFALTERLSASPRWLMRASDLSVKDVLYASQNGMRCFVATAKCRWSLDQEVSRFVIRITERADHQSDFEIAWEASDHSPGDAAVYRKLLGEWCGQGR